MRRLNLGCGRNPFTGWINVDVAALPGVDVVADLNACAHQSLPFLPNSVEMCGGKLPAAVAAQSVRAQTGARDDGCAAVRQADP